MLGLIWPVAQSPHAAQTVSPSPRPKRIVSLNLCTDQLLMLLVEPERIAGVSFLARDPQLSNMVELAERLRPLRGTAEEILELDPDLVITSPYTTRATTDLLARLGRRVVSVPLSESLQGVRDGLRQIGDATGDGAAATRIIADFDTALARVAREDNATAVPDAVPPSALVYHIAGLVSAPGSLIDEVLRTAGVANAAATLRTDPKGVAALELVVTHPPDLLILGNAPGDYRTVMADNLRTPALSWLMGRLTVATVPARLWTCATPHVLGAVALLVRARAGITLARRKLSHKIPSMPMDTHQVP